MGLGSLLQIPLFCGKKYMCRWWWFSHLDHKKHMVMYDQSTIHSGGFLFACWPSDYIFILFMYIVFVSCLWQHPKMSQTKFLPQFPKCLWWSMMSSLCLPAQQKKNNSAFPLARVLGASHKNPRRKRSDHRSHWPKQGTKWKEPESKNVPGWTTSPP